MENLDWMEDIREFKTNVEYTGILVAITYLNENNEKVITTREDDKYYSLDYRSSKAA